LIYGIAFTAKKIAVGHMKAETAALPFEEAR